jgi:uncharacterized protein (TIGR01777 family)
MRILLSGGSGFLGTALRIRFADLGHEVRRLVRTNPLSSSEFHWDPMAGRINAAALAGVDVIVNLAGPPVFTRPWTDSRRKLLREARIESTRLLAETIVEQYAGSDTKPLWLQASATGWYGTASGPEPHDEGAPAASTFLGRLAHDWEAATQQAQAAGVPVTFLRNAMVLDQSGSTLRTILPVFRWGIGGRLGSGRQRMAIISLHDWLRAVTFLIDERPPPGPYNLTIPHPPSNAEFTEALARELGRPARFTAPERPLRAVLGPQADQLLADEYVTPAALLEQGFSFDGPDVTATLRLALQQSG